MKKALFASVGAILIGGMVAMSFFDKEQTVESPETAVQASDSQTVAIDTPLLRTVETNGGYPWEYFTAKDIIAKQDSGEVVFLLSDAQPLEDMLKGFAVSEEVEGAPITKAENGASFGEYLDGFVQGVEKYHPGNKEYFDKLREVVIDLKSGNFEGIPQKIEDAKTYKTN